MQKSSAAFNGLPLADMLHQNLTNQTGRYAIEMRPVLTFGCMPGQAEKGLMYDGGGL
jgi:hypothetical protein